MNIQQMQYVLAVAEKRHFEAAAEHCCITQSTLSTMISKFEEEIGLQIFNRKKKPVEITNEGKIVIEQLKIIINQLNQFNEVLKEIKGEVKGKLTISVIPTIAPFLLPLFLQDFAKKFPDLEIEVKEQTTQEIIQQIKSRYLDIGILSTPIDDAEIVEYPLYDEPFVLFDVGGKNPNQVAVNEMNTSNLWLMEEGHCMRTQVLKLCDLDKQQMSAVPNLDFKAGSIDSLIRFVKANRGTTLLPYLSVAQFSETDQRHLRYFTAPTPKRTVGLVVHKHFVKKKLLELMVKEILEKVVIKI